MFGIYFLLRVSFPDEGFCSSSGGRPGGPAPLRPRIVRTCIQSFLPLYSPPPPPPSSLSGAFTNDFTLPLPCCARARLAVRPVASLEGRRADTVVGWDEREGVGRAAYALVFCVRVR